MGWQHQDVSVSPHADKKIWVGKFRHTPELTMTVILLRDDAIVFVWGK
jgi:hypothetical protein